MRLTWVDFSPSARCIELSGRNRKERQVKVCAALGEEQGT
jgi:hypothetical protein